MTARLCDFIGVQCSISSSADQKVNEIVQQIFNSIENLLEVNLRNYNNLNDLINRKKEANNEQSYFWDWLEEKGEDCLHKILTYDLPDNEELLDLLDYREMLLEMDIETGVLDSFFTSVADTLVSIREYALASLEQSATQDGIVREGHYKRFNTNALQKGKNIKYVVMKNPAEHQQDFCYYM